MEFKRLFTREEAVRTLPLVRRIVEDILKTAERLRSLNGPERGLRREDEGKTKVSRDRSALEAALREHFSELAEIGCFYKDWSFSTGLVDFPSELNGEIVFLCWRSDEPELAWYHPVEEGYRGRRPLPGARRREQPPEE